MGSSVGFFFYQPWLNSDILYSDTLRIGIWTADIYTDVADAGLGPLIQLDTILSHIVRAKANVVGQLCWVTVMLDRVCLSFALGSI